MKTVTITARTYHKGNQFKPATVYYPNSNRRLAAMIDDEEKLVGLDTDRVYHPDGGHKSISQITETDQCLVEGSRYYQYPCRHTHGNQYMIVFNEDVLTA